jgi:hypothetical protein
MTLEPGPLKSGLNNAAAFPSPGCNGAFCLASRHFNGNRSSPEGAIQTQPRAKPWEGNVQSLQALKARTNPGEGGLSWRAL